MNKPEHLDPLAEVILERLRQNPVSSQIVLGGYFGLQQYLDYRRTHDIDAWWRQRATPEAEGAIRQVMQQVAAEKGHGYKERRFGDTISFDIVEGNKQRLSFQIAVRDIALDDPQVSLWPPILIETLRDNLGSKMNALVDRGAPRDFVDIHKAVEAGLTSVPECWHLWSLKNPGQRIAAAKAKALLHLEGLEQRLPLSEITNPAERTDAQTRRQWFRQSFLSVSGPERESPGRELAPG